jgi:hypothetical protein
MWLLQAEKKEIGYWLSDTDDGQDWMDLFEHRTGSMLNTVELRGGSSER